jgi:hypothetical protein
MDELKITREIETINKQLLDLLDKLMGVEQGTEDSEALNAVANAVLFLENYLYPESATWFDEDLCLDDGE